jgi:hypothetical protein
MVRSNAQPGDKNNPLVIQGKGMYLISFQHQGEVVLAISIPGKVDFAEAIALPSNLLVMNDWVAIFSRRDVTLATSDFPAMLKPQLDGFWPSGQIKLLARGFVTRAEPTGDFLDAARDFLMLDKIDGKSVVSFEKNSLRNTTALMLWGTISRPFGMEMTLTNPEIGFTKKEGKPNPTISLASNVDIYGHPYEFKAEASKKIPDILLLKTTSLNPQDLVNIERAMAKPLFGLAVGTTPPWKLDLIPTFSLKPPKVASPNFPTEDRQKVVVYSALPGADRPDWGIKGPGIKVRGSLTVDLLPTSQEIAVVEAVLDQSTLSMSFALPNFKLPKSDLTFGTASADIGAAAGSGFMKIRASSGSNCFKQDYTFTVDAKGMPTLDANANGTLPSLDPAGFMNNMKACANEGQKGVEFALRTGEALLGFGRDKLVGASTGVFGAELTAFAANVIGYPVAVVSSALAAAGLSPDALLDVGSKVYGAAGVGAFAKGAGVKAMDLAAWGVSRGLNAPGVGTLMNGAGYATNDMMAAAKKYFPAVPIGGFVKNAGIGAEQFLTWTKGAATPIKSAGEWLGTNTGINSTTLLNAASTVYGNEKVAEFGKSLGMAPATVVSWGVDVKRLGAKDIGGLFRSSGFPTNDVLNAVYSRLPTKDVGAAAKELGVVSEDLFVWAKSRRISPNDAAYLAKDAYDQMAVYINLKTTYALSNEAAAEMGKLAGYAADNVATWFKRSGFDAKGVAQVLRAGGFAQAHVTAALQQVYSIGADAAEKAWKEAEKIGGQIGGYLDPRNW